MPAKIYGIAFGGNLGVPKDVFQTAIQFLDERGVRLKKFSSLMKSRPMGENSGSEYTNAAALVSFEGQPQDLLNILHACEAAAGRIRSTFWGPRPLDLDLICCEHTVINTPQLIVPHPLMWFRRFVVQPLNELIPNWRHPTLNETASELLDRINQRPLMFQIANARPDQHAEIEAWEQRNSGDVLIGNTKLTTDCTATLVLTSNPRPSQPPLEHQRQIRLYVTNGLEAELGAVRDAMLD